MVKEKCALVSSFDTPHRYLRRMFGCGFVSLVQLRELSKLSFRRIYSQTCVTLCKAVHVSSLKPSHVITVFNCAKLAPSSAVFYSHISTSLAGSLPSEQKFSQERQVLIRVPVIMDSNEPRGVKGNDSGGYS